jgi:hypothetical protein
MPSGEQSVAQLGEGEAGEIGREEVAREAARDVGFDGIDDLDFDDGVRPRARQRTPMRVEHLIGHPRDGQQADGSGDAENRYRQRALRHVLILSP